MGGVRQAVLEFDEEVQAPWRPRLVAVPALDGPAALPPTSSPTSSAAAVTPAVGSAAAARQRSRRSPSRVGVCRPPAPNPGRPGVERRRPAVRPVPGVAGLPTPRAERRDVGTGSPGLRLTRRARRLAVLLALCGGVVLGSWLAPLVSGDGQALDLAGVSTVVVEPGDTLWSIASSVADGEDVRAVVDHIQELNQMTGSDVVPGQVLRLP